MCSAFPDRGSFATPLDAWLADLCGARSPQDLSLLVRRRQIAELEATLEHALHSSFYAERLRQSSFALEDLSRDPLVPLCLSPLPCTFPSDLTAWQRLLCVSGAAIERVVTLCTSGTTGPPKRIACTASDLEGSRAFFRFGMAGIIQSGERLCVLMPGGERPNGVADLLKQALAPQDIEVTYPSSSLVNALCEGYAPNEVVDWLERFRPNVLVALTSVIATLSRFLPLGLPGCSRLLSSGELLSPELSACLSRQWGCEVFDHYGLTEAGYGLAVHCHAHTGYHLRALDAVVEIVDPATGSTLPPGAVGEIVVTTLRREAMPLIRYRTGDLGSLCTDPCGCGSPLPRLGALAGRLNASSRPKGAFHAQD